MNISLDDTAKNTLRDMLKEKGKDAVRVVIKGFGWSGPSFGIVLDEQKDDDDFIMVEDIKIIAEKEFSFLFNDAKIVMTKGYFGNSFDIVIGDKIAGSCS